MFFLHQYQNLTHILYPSLEGERKPHVEHMLVNSVSNSNHHNSLKELLDWWNSIPERTLNELNSELKLVAKLNIVLRLFNFIFLPVEFLLRLVQSFSSLSNSKGILKITYHWYYTIAFHIIFQKDKKVHEIFIITSELIFFYCINMK